MENTVARRSLAEALGISAPANGGSPSPGVRSVKAFARGVLDSQEYRSSLMRRIAADELPAQIEALLYHYAGGKPAETLRVEDETRKAVASADTLTLEQRALQLAAAARELASNGMTDSDAGAAEGPPIPPASVH